VEEVIDARSVANTNAVMICHVISLVPRSQLVVTQSAS
jgi:hypothetical protein